EQVLQTFPWFQAGHFLYLSLLKSGDSFLFPEKLKSSAIFLPDRKKLFTSLENPFLKETQDERRMENESIRESEEIEEAESESRNESVSESESEKQNENEELGKESEAVSESRSKSK